MKNAEETIAVSDQIALTGFQAGDKANLIRYLNDTEVVRNTLLIPHPYTETDADNWLALTEQKKNEYGRLTNWAVRHRDAGLIGGIGCFVKTGLEGHRDEIGYWLAAPFRGQGIMGAVVERLSGYLFDTRPLVRIEAWVYSHNPASLRVLEKAGFQREGYARKLHCKNGVYIDAILMAKIKA